jgi:hypothetical protein
MDRSKWVSRSLSVKGRNSNLQRWNLYWYARKDPCDDYRACGVYGVCDSNRSPTCKCPKGFKPKNEIEWDLRDGSDGCVRKKGEMDCGRSNVGFLKLERMKLADSERAFVDSEMDLKECEEKCRKNCSCSGLFSFCLIFSPLLNDFLRFESDSDEFVDRFLMGFRYLGSALGKFFPPIMKGLELGDHSHSD